MLATISTPARVEPASQLVLTPVFANQYEPRLLSAA